MARLEPDERAELIAWARELDGDRSGAFLGRVRELGRLVCDLLDDHAEAMGIVIRTLEDVSTAIDRATARVEAHGGPDADQPGV